MARALALVTTLVALAGCGQGRALSDPPAATGDGGCELGYAVKAIKPFACSDPSYFTPGPALAAGDGVVVYAHKHTLGSNSATDSDLFSLHAATGDVEQITGDDSDTLLLGVSGRAVLFAVDAGYKQSPRVVLRHQHGTVDLGFHKVDPMLGAGMFTYGPSQPVSNGQATWRTKEAIYFYDGSKVRKLVSLGKQVYAGTGPYLDHGTAVWSQWDGTDLEIYLHRDGTTRQITSNTTHDRYPVVSAGRVFWSCDSGICSWLDGKTTLLDQGACGHPDTHQGQAAWVCDNRVTLFDGQQIRKLTDDKVARSSVRLNSGRLVWLEIRDAKQSPYAGSGTLVFSDGQRHQDLQKVGLPCMTCSAYWPPLGLSLSGNVLAWSYADPLPGAKPPYEHCAYAEIESRCTP